MTLQVGIVGLGVMGRRRRAAIDAHPGIHCAAICDVDPALERHADGARFSTRWEALLGADLEALFLCLPNHLNAEVTRTAMQRGLHVFCEKPPACTTAELEPVLEVERAHPELVLMYGLNHRLHGSVIEARRRVDSGAFGAVINLRGVYGKSDLVSDRTAWRSDANLAGGGILLDQGIHLVDLMRVFGGEFVDVAAFTSDSREQPGVEHNAYALMRSEAGVVAMLHSSATEWPHRFRLEIGLEQGQLTLDGILSGTGTYAPERLIVAHRATPEDAEVLEFDTDDSWALEVQCFEATIRGVRTAGHGSSEDARGTLDLVERIYAAAAL